MGTDGGVDGGCPAVGKVGERGAGVEEDGEGSRGGDGAAGKSEVSEGDKELGVNS